MATTETHSGAVLEVDLAAIAANWHALRARHPGGEVGAVVKADGYGLGAEAVARRLAGEGCRCFFVATPAEALALRAVLPEPVIVTLNGLADAAAALAEAAITPALASLGEVAAWAGEGRRRGRRLPALLHLDTGMSRLGLDQAEQDALAADPSPLDAIALRGVMTHLVAAERPDDPLNAQQLARFAAARARLPPAPASLANSSGLFLGPAFATDLARPGAALYGINPTPDRPNPMRPAVRLRARVLQVRAVAAGASVGYNATWRTARPARIATLAIGYADGWPRALSGRGAAYFDGEAAPLVGRVSMDLTTCDVTGLAPVRPGDWAELIGPHAPLDAVAAAAGTIGYEILTGLGPRIARVTA